MNFFNCGTEGTEGVPGATLSKQSTENAKKKESATEMEIESSHEDALQRRNLHQVQDSGSNQHRIHSGRNHVRRRNLHQNEAHQDQGFGSNQNRIQSRRNQTEVNNREIYAQLLPEQGSANHPALDVGRMVYQLENAHERGAWIEAGKLVDQLKKMNVPYGDIEVDCESLLAGACQSSPPVEYVEKIFQKYDSDITPQDIDAAFMNTAVSPAPLVMDFLLKNFEQHLNVQAFFPYCLTVQHEGRSYIEGAKKVEDLVRRQLDDDFNNLQQLNCILKERDPQVLKYLQKLKVYMNEN